MNKDFLERVIRRLRLMLRIAFSRTAIIVVALLLQVKRLQYGRLCGICTAGGGDGRSYFK